MEIIISKKIKSIMMFALLLCGLIGSSFNASAYTSTGKDYYVSGNNIWNIFVKKSASVETNTHYVTNKSGKGDFGYCYFKIEGKLGTDGTTSTLMSKKKILKNSTKTACSLSNKIGKGKTCILRVTGADTQTKQDLAHITYYY